MRPAPGRPWCASDTCRLPGLEERLDRASDAEPQIKTIVDVDTKTPRNDGAFDPKIIDAIVERHLDDLRQFAAAVLQRFSVAP